MYRICVVILLAIFSNIGLFAQAIVKQDNGEPRDHYYTSTRNFFEESMVLTPDGPCDINKILIYLSGDSPAIDTIWVCGFPTSGNLWPTQYIWEMNTLIDPVPYEYSGEPGWVELDISAAGLRSEGLDRIVLQHRMKPDGPWFTYDTDGTSNKYDSWVCDPFTPNPNFLNIAGTIFSYPPGDYMCRFEVEYDYPDGESSLRPPAPTLVDVSAQAGLNGGAYVSVVDWNNDGWDDLEMNGNMYENQKNGTFKNVNDHFDITRGNSAWCDFNNDGFLDLFILKGWKNDKLYKNNGDGTFEDVTALSGIINDHPTMTALWIDYNNDALPDLFLANNRSGTYPDEIYHPDQLWKNNGDGTFTNVREESRIPAGEGSGYDCYGASATDYNKDNKTDVFVANYRLAPDNLYMNNGDGTFTDKGAETGTRGVPTQSSQYFGHGMGCEWADFNNDTWPDLCVGNLAHTDSRGAVSNPSLIFMNEGPENNFSFKEMHKSMGLKFFEGNGGVCWLDLDLDGWQDIWHGLYNGGISHLYLNGGAPEFKLTEITWLTGTAVENAWTAVRTDFDRDGDIDLIIAGKLFRNDMERKGNWVAFRIKGSPENNVCMDAFGTKITVYAGEQTFYRELSGSAAGSRNAQHSYELHFGIGDNESIEKVVVNYPNGEAYTINSIEINKRYTIPYMSDPVMNYSACNLISPKNFESKLSLNPSLKWDGKSLDNKYRIQVSKTPDFSEFIVNEEIENLEYQLSDIEDNSIYYWRVLTNSDNYSLFSSTWIFVTGDLAPSAPQLTSPANEDVDVSVKPLFSWTTSSYEGRTFGKTTYHLQISDNDTFDGSFVTNIEGIEGVSYLMDGSLEPGETYYWRVRGLNDETPGAWSGAFSFTTLSLPAIPVLKSPEDGAVDVDIKPRFDWEMAENAKSYILEVSADEEFNNVFHRKEDIKIRFYNMKDPFCEYNTQYFWRMKAVNEGGGSNWTETRSFTTMQDNSVKDNFPIGFGIKDITPNPVSETSIIEIDIPESSFTELKIYNNIGELTATLLTDYIGRGKHSYSFDTNELPSGAYYCRLISGLFCQNEKIIVSK